MRLFCIADTHGEKLILDRAGKCDFIFLLGDMGGSYAWQIKDFLLDHPVFENRIFSVLGNHDDDLNALSYPWLRFQEYGSIKMISDGNRQCSVLFLPFREHYSKIVPFPHADIIISHQPPVTYPGMQGFHKGVPYFGYLRKNMPEAVWIHGHVHLNCTAQKKHTQSVFGSRIIQIT